MLPVSRQLARLEKHVADLGGGDCPACDDGKRLALVHALADGSQVSPEPDRYDGQARCVLCGTPARIAIIVHATPEAPQC